jgi:transcriptional regulator with XRE-family HTH domain
MARAPKKPKSLFEPNRIGELRAERGWTLPDLAEAIENKANVTISDAQLGKLERRERKLTLKYMRAIAQGFEVEAYELLDLAAMAGTTNDVEPKDDEPHAKVLVQRGLRYYKVVSDACIDAGFGNGKIILGDENQEGIAKRATGDLLIVETRPGKSDSLLLLRVFVAPDKLMTNRPSSNIAMKIGKNKIRAIVVPEGTAP